MVAARRTAGRAAAGGATWWREAQAGPLRSGELRCAAGAAAGATWCRRLRACWTTLPLTPNGKVDRQRAAGAGVGRAAEATTWRRARRRRRSLAAIWAERAAAWSGWACTTNFFELGGHSLLATQVVSRVRDGVRRGAAAAGAVRAPTVAGLAARVEAAAAGRGSGAAAALAPVERAEALPLSFAQQRLWFLDQLEPGERGLQHAGRAAADGAPRPCAALERALDEVVRAARGAAHDGSRAWTARRCR